MHFKTHQRGDIVIYDIEWDFKITDDIPAALHNDVKSHLKSGVRWFIFDLAGVKFMDSYGLGEIVACFISISNQKGKLKLANLPSRISNMFKVAGLDPIFDIFDSEEAAVKDFQ